MDIMAMDISILVISLVVATAVIVLYSFSGSTSCSHHFCTESFAVVDIVNSLKKNCPISFSNKWRLLPLCVGLSRCWTKKVLFPGFQNSINLCGVTFAATCSSVYAFSLIADVTNWGEWELLPATQNLLLKTPSDVKLQKDNYMQADKIVGMQRGTNVQSFKAMYRFMSFQEKTVKWLLFWNAKKVEFMFFLIQPAISKTVDSQCLISHIYGSTQFTPHIATYVAQRLKNIAEFLTLSQLHIIASNCTPAVPAVPASQETPPKMQILKEKKPKALSDTSRDKRVFALVPNTQYVRYFYKRMVGFELIVRNMPIVTRENKTQDSELKVKSGETKEPLMRSMSEVALKQRKLSDTSNNLELSKVKNKTSASVMDLKCTSSIIVEENLNLNVEPSNSRDLGRRCSEPGISPKSDKRKSSSNSDCSEMHTDEETYVNLHIIRENREENEYVSKFDRNPDIFCSSTSEFEMLDPNQQFLDCKIADFLTQGNYGASELQAEMMLASQFNRSLSAEEQTSGGWVYHSSYKGITVLSKTTAGQFMKILSFLCQFELPVAYHDVWKCVKNPRFRFMSDETVKTVKIVERISDTQKLIHVYHETSGIIRKEAVDFCLLQTEREEANHFYSSFHSIEYEKCPFMTSVIRGSLRPSGWVVERLEPKRCKVTHLVQILVNSPDSLFIQDLSSIVPLAMHNLKNYIASKPK